MPLLPNLRLQVERGHELGIESSLYSWSMRTKAKVVSNRIE
jgi:hypothetical protein